MPLKNVRIAPNNPVFGLPVIEWTKARGLTEGQTEHATLVV